VGLIDSEFDKGIDAELVATSPMRIDELSLASVASSLTSAADNPNDRSVFFVAMMVSRMALTL